jgi:hypothetical protein
MLTLSSQIPMHPSPAENEPKETAVATIDGAVRHATDGPLGLKTPSWP